MMSRSFCPSKISQLFVQLMETLFETYCSPFQEVVPGRRLAV